MKIQMIKDILQIVFMGIGLFGLVGLIAYWVIILISERMDKKDGVE